MTPKNEVQAARAALMPAVLTRLVQNTFSNSRVPKDLVSPPAHQKNAPTDLKLFKTVFTEWSFWRPTRSIYGTNALLASSFITPPAVFNIMTF